ncbi:sigma-70 family RNA polymerase sigma factor [Psychrobacter sp. HD31]|uniref:sigma-70 family RNA polymerase sigma factor n=1 Tax=Psychrobacter sp. HD31 TaxID=3112003 RepID=UPI003DA27023
MSATSDTKAKIDDKFIADVYEQMLAFAISQFKDEHQAQDAVQEALTAALNHSDKFNGKATFKTWVFSILKNKIIDEIRSNNRYVNISSMQSDDGNTSDEEFISLLFDDAGFWYKNGKPSAFDNSWCEPETQAHGEEFWQVLEFCLNKLPAEQSRVFIMREYIELETNEICAEVGINSNKFYVLMHRARLRLQQCLSIRWFAEQ